MEVTNLLGSLDFDEVYEMEISTNGVTVKEKIKNIIGSDEVLFKLFREDRKDFFLPNTDQDNADYGVGIGFEKYKNQVSDVFAFTAKLDKSKTILNTKYREINEFNFSEALSLVKDKKYTGLITKGIQLSKLFKESIEVDLSLTNIKSMISLFSSSLESYPEQMLYLRKSRKSFVKKHTISRSEEHTSELQSRPHLVCRLLL